LPSASPHSGGRDLAKGGQIALMNTDFFTTEKKKKHEELLSQRGTLLRQSGYARQAKSLDADCADYAEDAVF
jgi:hypothetical protein